MKNSADQGGCYPQRLKAEVDNTLRGLQNSSYPTKAEFKIALLLISISLFKFGEKRPIVCCCTHEQKMNFEGFTQLEMVAMATSHTLWRFYLIALT